MSSIHESDGPEPESMAVDPTNLAASIHCRSRGFSSSR